MQITSECIFSLVFFFFWGGGGGDFFDFFSSTCIYITCPNQWVCTQHKHTKRDIKHKSNWRLCVCEHIACKSQASAFFLSFFGGGIFGGFFFFFSTCIYITCPNQWVCAQHKHTKRDIKTQKQLEIVCV